MDEEHLAEVLAEWSASPEFQLRAWDFLHTLDAGSPVPSAIDFFLAAYIGSMFGGLYKSFVMTVRGSSPEQAAAEYAALVASQRDLHGSLAVMTDRGASGDAEEADRQPPGT